MKDNNQLLSQIDRNISRLTLSQSTGKVDKTLLTFQLKELSRQLSQLSKNTEK